MVLFFYPAAMTYGCTKESCHFRDMKAEFEAVGAQRVGISADQVEKQKQFSDKHQFDYPLLSDPDGAVATQFGVRRGFAKLSPTKRATFVIGPDLTRPRRHPERGADERPRRPGARGAAGDRRRADRRTGDVSAAGVPASGAGRCEAGGMDRTPSVERAVSPLPGPSRMEQLVEAIAERVVNLVLDAIDINAIVGQVDMDALLTKVDVDAIVSRVDVDRVVGRVDVDKTSSRRRASTSRRSSSGSTSRRSSQRVDIDALVEQTELGTIIARSTSGVASEVLDVVRAQGVGLDDFVARWVNRILRRSPRRLAARAAAPWSKPARPVPAPARRP